METKVVRITKTLHDKLSKISEKTGRPIGGLITELATTGCQGCGASYLIDDANWENYLRKKNIFWEECEECRPSVTKEKPEATPEKKEVKKAPKSRKHLTR